MPNSQTGESSAKEYNPASGSMNFGLVYFSDLAEGLRQISICLMVFYEKYEYCRAITAFFMNARFEFVLTQP